MHHNPFIDILSQGQSRKMADQVISMILDGAADVQDLMDCFFSDEMRVCQRAAWPVGILAEKNQEILDPYLLQMISTLDSPKHDAVVRNILRAFQFMDIPEKQESEVYDRCLDYLSDPKYPIAFTAFGMTVCANIAMKYTELRVEVVAAIDYRMPHGSSGIRARGTKEKKRLLASD